MDVDVLFLKNKSKNMKLLEKIIDILCIWYIYKKEIFSLNKELLLEKHSLGLITICFNSADILKLQYQHIKENLLDDYIYIIADNSNNKVESNNIILFAKENNLVYIKLPYNPYSNINASKSHGLALNFIYKKIISNNNLKYLGFLDQDIFPVSKLSIIKKIDNLPSMV
jgi:hypothetical protein